MKKFELFENLSVHDIDDSYKIALYNGNMEPISEDELSDFVEKLEDLMTEVGIDMEYVSMNEYDYYVTFDQVMPSSKYCSKYINDLTSKVMELAANEGLTAIMMTTFYCTHLGKDAKIYCDASILRGNIAYAEAIYYREEDEDSDDYLYFDGDGEEIDSFDISNDLYYQLEGQYEEMSENPLEIEIDEEEETCLQEPFESVVKELLEDNI